MPFDPLETDERLEAPVKAAPDFDSQMLFGCSAFVSTSLGTYALAIWPFFAIADTHLLNRLMLAALIGAVPSTIVGIAMTRRGGLAGACGYLGGTMALCVFLFLRIEQIMLGLKLKELPLPDYPPSFQTWFPLGWLCWTLLLCLIFLPRSEFKV